MRHYAMLVVPFKANCFALFKKQTSFLFCQVQKTKKDKHKTNIKKRKKKRFFTPLNKKHLSMMSAVHFHTPC